YRPTRISTPNGLATTDGSTAIPRSIRISETRNDLRVCRTAQLLLKHGGHVVASRAQEHHSRTREVFVGFESRCHADIVGSARSAVRLAIRGFARAPTPRRRRAQL